MRWETARVNSRARRLSELFCQGNLPQPSISDYSFSDRAVNKVKEKRIEPRYDVCFTARWAGSVGNYNVRITDFSEGGCYVDTIAEVTEGETLLLQILVRESEWFELQGVVAHHSPRLGFGVRFINLDDHQREVIRSLLPGGNPLGPKPDLLGDTPTMNEKKLWRVQMV